MALNHMQITNAKPREQTYRLADSDGLYLLVQANGSKLWRMNYRYAGRQKTLALGVYPAPVFHITQASVDQLVAAYHAAIGG